MYIDDKTDDSGQNLMHQTNDEIHIGENAKVIKHDPEFVNIDEGENEDNLESTHRLILAINVIENNARICNSKNVPKIYTRSQPRS